MVEFLVVKLVQRRFVESFYDAANRDLPMPVSTPFVSVAGQEPNDTTSKLRGWPTIHLL